MNKLVKIPLYVVGGAVALVALLAGSVYGLSSRRLSRTHEVQARPVLIPTDAAAIERGRHIAKVRSCADCHGQDFGGAKVIDDPVAGRLHGPNLTRGRGGLAAGYSDEDYVRAIRHGVAQNGRALVLMPSIEYTELSDQDLGALIAYLKSLPAVDRERGPVQLGPALRLAMLKGDLPLWVEKIDHVAPRPAVVNEEVSVAYGRYLATSCTGCHGPNLSGGRIPGAPPDWPSTSNLTPHESSRLSGWSEADFVQTLRTHRRPDGSELHPVMPAAIGAMTDTEIKALWLYLRSLPAYETGAR